MRNSKFAIKRSTKTLVALAIVAFASSAFARIGETLDQCAARYGAQTGNSGPDAATFNRDHIVITVHLRGNRSIAEDYAPESGGSISPSQIAGILGENAEGSTWDIMGETPVSTSYFRKDSRAVATVAKEGAQLTTAHAQVIVKYTVFGKSLGSPFYRIC